MKNLLTALPALVLALGVAAGQHAWAEGYNLGPSETVAKVGDELFTPVELDELLAPIALYPDPLVAQILPAATFIDQIDEAARFVRLYDKYGRVDDQPWDVSVKALAYYPEVLFMMDQKYDWTMAVGQAFVSQPEDVMESIQHLREEALRMGNLVSTRQQTVVVEDGIIRIVPAQPEVIYVPVYDPALVYLEPPQAYGLINFGVGFTIGAWLNRDCDWHRRRVYYHGWQGGGWIGRARPHVHVRNTVYINNRYREVQVNRRVVERDILSYREDIRRSALFRRERTGRPAGPPREPAPGGKVEQRGRQPRPSGSALRAVPTGTGPAERPAGSEVYRGRDKKGSQAAPSTGYGGYGSSSEIRKYRERGQDSREDMRRTTRPPTVQQTSPEQRSAPAQPVTDIQTPAAGDVRQFSSPPAGQREPRQGGADRGGSVPGGRQR